MDKLFFAQYSVAGNGYMPQWRWSETHSGLPADKCSWLHWATKLATWLTRSKFHGVLNLECSSAAGILSEGRGHGSTETSPKQWLAQCHIQPRTDQRCYWPRLLFGRSFARLTHWALFTLILWRLLIASFISVKLCLEKVGGIDAFEVVHLPATEHNM